jgi:hypothetical protein
VRVLGLHEAIVVVARDPPRRGSEPSLGWIVTVVALLEALAGVGCHGPRPAHSPRCRGSSADSTRVTAVCAVGRKGPRPAPTRLRGGSQGSSACSKPSPGWVESVVDPLGSSSGHLYEQVSTGSRHAFASLLRLSAGAWRGLRAGANLSGARVREPWRLWQTGGRACRFCGRCAAGAGGDALVGHPLRSRHFLGDGLGDSVGGWSARARVMRTPEKINEVA